MDSTTSKISFIPKGSLVREESYLARRRPQSVIGFIAMFVFILTVGSYAGLYFYEISLSKEVGTKTAEIGNAQKLFSATPEVSKAKLFSSRANLAKELLSSHIVVSPVFAFLSRNTVGNIFYDKFSFLYNANMLSVELSGEAPTYATLAYQTDVLKEQSKELSQFSVRDITLTKFGTVAFTLNLVFKSDYLSYSKNIARAEVASPQAPQLPPVMTTSSMISVPTIIDASTTIPSSFQPVYPSEGTSTVITAGEFVQPTSSTTQEGLGTTKTTTDVSVQPATEPFLMSLWSRFKFW